MSWADDDLFSWFDPKERDMSKRDYKWLRSIWTRTLIDSNTDRYIGKLFSVSTNVPSFLESFPDAKILYILIYFYWRVHEIFYFRCTLHDILLW